MQVAETGRLTITSKKGADVDVHISELQNLHAPLWMLLDTTPPAPKAADGPAAANADDPAPA